MVENRSEPSDTPVNPVRQAGQTETPITPKLVRQVVEKVYALWLRDVQLERERLGLRINSLRKI